MNNEPSESEAFDYSFFKKNSRLHFQKNTMERQRTNVLASKMAFQTNDW